MHKILFISVFFLVELMLAQEEKFIKSAETENATILQIGDSKAWCSVCGMNLKMFYKTNHAVELDDGTALQYCSIRCLCADEPNYKEHIKAKLVVDAATEKFIYVKDAHYVIGSKAPGTMTKVSKIAFSGKKDAEEFSKKFDGKSIVDFDVAYKMAAEQLETNNDMLMKKKEIKIYPKGKKLYEKLCDKDIDLPKFNFISDLKAHIKNSNLCKEMEEKQLQAVALYLWDIKLKGISVDKNNESSISVPKDAKCPVCGMFVYKYPRWAAALEISHNNKTEKLYFDGVKDLIKFYFEPEKWGSYNSIKILNIQVTDYYKQTSIAGKKAVYVIGSDILGPMGHELIPFETEKNAKIFSLDHLGKKIIRFDDITNEMIYKLDE